MASTGIFIGLTEQQLLAIRDAALTELTTGKVVTSYSDSGTSISKTITMPARERFEEATFALAQLNPTTYGERTTVIKCDWSNYAD